MVKKLLIIFLFLYQGFVSAQNTDISNGAIFDGEPYLAIDPYNSQHLVIAWMGYPALTTLAIKIKVSFNGGQTWSNTTNIPHQLLTWQSADPSLGFDHDGNVYLCYIDSHQNPDTGAVFVRKSTDGGMSWSSAYMVINGNADGAKYPLDRPWLVINRTSGSTPDTFYVTTKPAPWISVPNRPYFTKSVNSGQTWQQWKYIDSTNYLAGNIIQAPMAAPAVSSSGQFHCVYPSFLFSQYPNACYIMASLVPGANSFTYSRINTITGTGINDTLAKAGGHLCTDPTDSSHLAFMFINNLYGDLDVFIVETLNNGSTWSTPVRINDDAQGNGKMQDMIWGDFDNNGNLITAWRDRRNANDTGYETSSEIWGAVRWKDSANFSTNFKISDSLVAYDSVLSKNGNDFMNVAMANDTMNAAWGDTRNGHLNIWFQRTALRTNISTGIQNITHEAIPIADIYPDPANDIITVKGSDIKEIHLLDMRGKELLKINITKEKTELDISNFVPGTYIFEIKTLAGSISKIFVKN